MKFYIYSQAIKAVKGGDVIGLMVKLLPSVDESLESEGVRRHTFIRSEAYYGRLKKMIESTGDAGEQWYVIDYCGDTGHGVFSMIRYLDKWED